MSPNLPLWHRRIFSMIEWDCLYSLGKHQPGFPRSWQADSLWWGALCVNMLTPQLQGEHWPALMGTTGTQITFPAEAGSENWRVPATRPLLSSRSYTEPNSNHVCSHPVYVHTQPALLPGWLVDKCCGLLVISGNIQPLLLTIVIWIPSLCNSTGVSWGKW